MSSLYERLAADVDEIKNNHLVHIQEDIAELKESAQDSKEKLIVLETKMDLAESYLGKILKLLFPIALGAGMLADFLGTMM